MNIWASQVLSRLKRPFVIYISSLVIAVLLAISISSLIGKLTSDLALPDPLCLSTFTALFGGFDLWLSSYSLLIFDLIFFSWIFAYLYILMHRNTLYVYNKCSQSIVKNRAIRIAMLVIIIVVVIVVLSYRFVFVPRPQGADTPNYIYVTNLICEPKDLILLVGDGREFSYICILFFRVVVEKILGMTSLISMMILPILIGFFYSLCVFYFAFKLFGDKRRGIMSFLFTGLSAFTIRLTYDLLAQTIGLSILVLALASLINKSILRGERYKRFSILLILLAASHTYTWFIVICILLMCILTSYLEYSKIPWQKIRELTPYFVPSLAYILVSIALASFFSSVPSIWLEKQATKSVLEGFLFPTRTGEIVPFSLAKNWNFIAEWEVPLLLFFSLVGVVSMWKKRLVLVFNWLAVLALLTIISGYAQSYRLLILTPIGLLAAEGFYTFFSFFVSFTRSKLERYLAYAFILLIIVCIFNSALYRAYIPHLVYEPGQQAYDQLFWIAKKYGFANGKILVLVKDTDQCSLNSFQWARAITGANVYLGDLLSLSQGSPFTFADRFTKVYNLSDFEEVIIPEALYTLGKFEKSLSKEIAKCVFTINASKLLNTTQLIEAGSIWFDNRFDEEWILVTNTLPHKLETNGFLSIEMQKHSPDSWATYEKKVFINGATKMIFSANGNLSGVQIFVEAYYSEGFAGGVCLEGEKLTPQLYIIELSNSKPVVKLRIAMHTTTNATVSGAWFQLQFIAFIG